MLKQVVLADFFSGCGGTSLGFSKAGIEPVVAVDFDADAAETYQRNFPQAEVFPSDIRGLEPSAVRDALEPAGRAIRLFAGCAPCQPFAGHQQNPTRQDRRTGLLLTFLRFVQRLQPELIFVENVPGLKRLSVSGGPFAEFVEEIEEDYQVVHETITSADYGVPQLRRRLILLASRLGPIELPEPTHGPETGTAHRTVRDAIGFLPAIAAGEEHPTFSSHRASRLSDLNLQRIRATPEGGDRRNWPKSLWPDCHRGDFRGHTDVYGRLNWDRPTPTLTTRCTSYSNGRFGHPEQDRALSDREAARLQTFPDEFEFSGSFVSQARQIGNAVPVVLAEHFGRLVIDHVREAAHQVNRGQETPTRGQETPTQLNHTRRAADWRNKRRGAEAAIETRQAA